MPNIETLHSEDEYDDALMEIEQYFDSTPAPGTPEAERFGVLAGVIEAYEQIHWPVDAAKV